MTPYENNAAPDRPLWWWAGLAAALLLVGLAAYFYWTQEPAPAPPVVSEPAPAPEMKSEAPAEPVIEHPVQAPEPAPVGLDDSDAPMSAALGELIGRERLANWFFTDALVRRFVATVDNLSRPMVAMRVRVLKPVNGPFAVDKQGDDVVIGAANAARYAPYVRALESVDTQQLAGVYLRFYPWFQQAYEELGYPKGYFNDRLVAVINHLLATPEPKGPVKLVQPKVLYQFADPELESLSAGQKALLRAGPDNSRRIKAKLRALRDEITRR
jgi:hypothetical protein